MIDWRDIKLGLDRGWSFVRLAPRGKKPVDSAWTRAPRATAQEILGWLKAGANVGIRTGSASGLVVIDVDKGGELPFEVPRTVTVITGSGGRHYYFKLPEGLKITNSRKTLNLPEKVDVRGDGGQAVFPGSVHPQTGKPYLWADGLSPEEVEIADFPDELRPQPKAEAEPRPKQRATRIEGGRRQKYAFAALDGEIDRVRTAAKGSRNDTLNTAALKLGQIVGSGELDAALVVDSLFSAASTWIGDDCAESEIKATIRSGMAAGRRQPRRLPELREGENGHGGNGYSNGNGAVGRNGHARSAERPVLADSRPLTMALAFLDHKKYLGDDGEPRGLCHFQDDFYAFRTNVYRKFRGEVFVAMVTRFLNGASVMDGEDTKPLRVTRAQVAETLHQLRTVCQVEDDTAPAWLRREQGDELPEPKDVLAFENGLLDARRFVDDEALVLTPSTPDWFSEIVIPCALSEDAQCPRWKAFLEDALGGDDELINLLQEWFGYCLMPDTSQQKMLWLHGVSGAGKSTVAQMLRQVVGERNTADFSLYDLTGQFGLSSFLGKTLAISGDAHLGHDADSRRVIEHLKAITGEDHRLVDRKNRDPLPSVRLPVRFVAVVNEFPSLPDAGDTLRRRSLIIPFERSFAESADTGLAAKLKRETAGVTWWALQGLRRLRANGEFTTAKRCIEMQDRFSRLASPVLCFMDECCEVSPPEPNGKPTAFVHKARLYRAYRFWAQRNGLSKHLTRERFCEAFFNAAKKAHPDAGIKPFRPRDENGHRPHVYANICLTSVIAEAVPAEPAEVREELQITGAG